MIVIGKHLPITQLATDDAQQVAVEHLAMFFLDNKGTINLCLGLSQQVGMGQCLSLIFITTGLPVFSQLMVTPVNL